MILRNLSIAVFADTAGLYEAAQAVGKDPHLSRNQIEIHEGGVLEAAQVLSEIRSPDVLIVGDCIDDDVWTRLERLSESVEPECKVIVVGPKDSISVYRELTAEGVSDYLGGKVGPQDLLQAIQRLYSTEKSLPKGKLILSMPSSGGAGGSTVAAVFAHELSKQVGDALLFDLDVNMGTAALALGLDVRDSVADALSNPGLDLAMLERFIVRDQNLKVLSTYGTLRSGLNIDPEIVEHGIFAAQTIAKAVVVDLPKGWTNLHQRLIPFADEILVVATPELASLRNARMLVDEINTRRPDGAPVRVLMNKAGLAKGAEYSGQDLPEALGSAPNAVIPWDPIPLVSALANGKSIAEATGKAVAALKAAAREISGAGKSGQTRKNSKADRPSSVLQGLIAKLV